MGRFKPGQSGNPAGRPTGAKGRIARAVEELLEGDARALTLKAIELALQGDVTALRLCLDRIAPVRKARVRFPMPILDCPADLPTAVLGIVQAVAEGVLTPDEAASVGAVLDAWRRSVDLVEIEARLRQVETELERSRAATGES